MRGTTAKTTFVSPISYDVGVSRGKRTYAPYFYLLQPGGDPLKLEYASKAEAQYARAQLLKPSEAHGVPSMKLFWAIQTAINHQG